MKSVSPVSRPPRPAPRGLAPWRGCHTAPLTSRRTRRPAPSGGSPCAVGHAPRRCRSESRDSSRGCRPAVSSASDSSGRCCCWCCVATPAARCHPVHTRTTSQNTSHHIIRSYHVTAHAYTAGLHRHVEACDKDAVL